ncbi:hypothetical protein EBR43_14200 [bacterium]|nr:hypothetical protein [bacterium]
MQIIVNNDYTTISGATHQLLQVLQSELTYTDKAKQYQLRRLSKSAWGRNSPTYHQLKKEVESKPDLNTYPILLEMARRIQ